MCWTMVITNPGDTAFPCSVDATDSGLSIRELMALKICAGFCANPNYSDLKVDPQVADVSVRMADALIDALNEEASTNG